MKYPPQHTTASVKAQRPFWIGAILLHLPYFIYALIQGPNLLEDSHEYLNQARSLSQGYFAYCGDLSDPLNSFFLSKRPPLYPLVLWLTGATTTWLGILVFQNTLSLLNLYLLRKLLIERKVYHAKAFGILVASSFSYFLYANSIMSEMLLVSTVVAMLFALHRFLRGERKYIWGYHLALCAAVLTKPVFFPFVFVNLLFWLFYKPGVLRAAVVPLLVVGLMFWRNARVTGVPHYSSIAYINLLDYNTYYFNVNRKGLQYADSISDFAHAQIQKAPDFKAKVDIMQDVAWQQIGEEPGSYASFHIKGAFKGMLDPGNFDFRTFFKVKGLGSLLNVLNQKEGKGFFEITQGVSPLFLSVLLLSLFNKLMLLLGTLWFAVQKEVHALWKVALTGLVLYVVMVTGPINASRFMLAVWPALLLASVQAWKTWRKAG